MFRVSFSKLLTHGGTAYYYGDKILFDNWTLKAFKVLLNKQTALFETTGALFGSSAA